MTARTHEAKQLVDRHTIQAKELGLVPTLFADKAGQSLELLKLAFGLSSSMDTVGVYDHEIIGERYRAAQIINDVFSRVT